MSVQPKSLNEVLRFKANKSPDTESELFLNRELAWLTFNDRVLKEAESRDTPLLERMKFLSIFSSNLDEFFMVRLSSLYRILDSQNETLAPTGYSSGEADPEETLDEVSLLIRRQLKRAYATFQGSLLPLLALEGVSLVRPQQLSAAETTQIDDFFENQIFPILTPLAVDQAHPFPYLANLSTYLAVRFKDRGDNGEPLMAFVEIPAKLSRFVSVQARNREHKYVVIEDLIKRHLGKLFPWNEIEDAYTFRVTRNLDYQLLEGEVKDLMKSIELELKDRAQRFVVRLEVEREMPEPLRAHLRSQLELDPSDIYDIPGILNLRELLFFSKIEMAPGHRDAPFKPRINFRLNDDRELFDVIRERDVLLHHPYESFSSVLEFLKVAAEDPNVLAIKQTLYRIGGDSPIIEALVRAAEKGKQVTAVVELKARFDERNNIAWARRLERAGAHVVFGFVGLKTHAKCALVIRKEGNHLQRYAHLSTGNYNNATARTYTDLGMLTADENLTNDLAKLFNLLTGFNLGASETKLAKFFNGPSFDAIRIAPFGLREFFISLIQEEARIHSETGNGHVVLKMNSLTDHKLIQVIYAASRAGVKFDLIVRGVCVLRPGIPGVSENVRVVSIIDRFLEHSRVFYFRNGAAAKVFVGSCDFMPRNMDRRIEVVWPVVCEKLKVKIIEILTCSLKDNIKAHLMHGDGSYSQIRNPRAKIWRSQERLLDLAKAERSLPARVRDSVRHLDAVSVRESEPAAIPLRRVR
jgi:polyphosphate kinase